MYQRSYPNTEALPPNYKGNAFDTYSDKDSRPPCEKCEKYDDCDKKEKDESKEEHSPVSSLFTRRDGSSFALDDIILGGLIVLLLNSHADDELLLVLVLLFISGI